MDDSTKTKRSQIIFKKRSAAFLLDVLFAGLINKLFLYYALKHPVMNVFRPSIDAKRIFFSELFRFEFASFILTFTGLVSFSLYFFSKTPGLFLMKDLSMRTSSTRYEMAAFTRGILAPFFYVALGLHLVPELTLPLRLLMLATTLTLILLALNKNLYLSDLLSRSQIAEITETANEALTPNQTTASDQEWKETGT